jgi:hypothetical protein
MSREDKTFYILDEPDLPTPYNHRYFVEKFAGGFALNGFKVEVIKSVGAIKENSMVMIAKHGLTTNDIFALFKGISKKETHIKKPSKNGIAGLFGNLISNPRLLRFYLLNNYKRAVNVLKKLSKIQNIVVICWEYHDHIDLLDELGINYILTNYRFYSDPASSSSKKWYQIYKTEDKALATPFAAAVDPDKVGEDCLNRKIKVCYIGNRSYSPEYYRIFIKRQDCKIVPTPPYIPEKERMNIYRNSMISLGLQDPEHIKNGVVTERVFESLAYGALCFSDNPTAAKITNGIVKFIEDKEHLSELVEHYVNNEEERLDLREKGFEFIKTQGTYKHVAGGFIDLATKLYDFKVDT